MYIKRVPITSMTDTKIWSMTGMWVCTQVLAYGTSNSISTSATSVDSISQKEMSTTNTISTGIVYRFTMVTSSSHRA